MSVLGIFGAMKIEIERNFISFQGFNLKAFTRDLRRKRLDFAVRLLLNRQYKPIRERISPRGYGDRRTTVKLHQFFALEFLYILRQLPQTYQYNEIMKFIENETWVKRINEEPNLPKLDMRSVTTDINIPLKPFQIEFIRQYLYGKYKYNLNGYILAFEQGLGKTITSLALMKSLGKTSVIIIAPKNTLHSVWANEIKSRFNTPKDVWIIGEKPRKADYYLVNYEMISRLMDLKPFLDKSKDVGIIVDECHNFRNINAKRVMDLREITKITGCTDILLMSGTPIKALGRELIPSLAILDPLFDERAMQVFHRLVRVQNEEALLLLKHRLSAIMHRRVIKDVLDLSEKTYENVKISFPGVEKYTLNNVKLLVKDWVEERHKYYDTTKHLHEKNFNDAVKYLDKELGDSPDYIRWKKYIKYLKTHKFNMRDDYIKENIQWANTYERTVLEDELPTNLRKKFRDSKTVVKYLSLRILGELLGGYLNELRSEMYMNAIPHSPLYEIIEKSEKKTIVFTTFVSLVSYLEQYIRTKYKMNPISISGTTRNVPETIKQFKTTNANPLIATIQSLSTGVTLVEANTVVFINPPWRSTDKLQAEHRVHRIGQDTDVYIYNFIIDTGNEPNLSTRMEEIVNWSQEMFIQIVGDESVMLNNIYRMVNDYKKRMD